jgi:type III pantothenate kinase
MILTVVVGNTNTRLVWFASHRPVRRRALPTSAMLNQPERYLRREHGITGSALASVVPRANKPVAEALLKATATRPLVVDRKTRTGLRVNYDRSQLGADRLCVAAGALRRYPGNTIVLDFGTATTVNVVTAHGEFLGGLIMPGIGMMIRCLADSTAQLPAVQPAGLRPAIAHDTRTAIRSGVVHLLSGGVGHVIDSVERKAGCRFNVVATGGYAPLMRRILKRIRRVDPDLANRGLAEIYYVNREDT